MKLCGIISLTFLCLITVSCSFERTKLRKQMDEFMQSEIIFPSSFHKIESGRLSPCERIQTKPVLVFYHDSSSCSLCQINRLHDRLDIYALSDSLGNFDVMTILSPKEEEYQEVIGTLRDRCYEFPVYIDYSREFPVYNSHIPEDVRFHTFLVDERCRPVFVGDPVPETTLWDIFCKTLDKITSTTENQ